MDANQQLFSNPQFAHKGSGNWDGYYLAQTTGDVSRKPLQGTRLINIDPRGLLRWNKIQLMLLPIKIPGKESAREVYDNTIMDINRETRPIIPTVF